VIAVHASSFIYYTLEFFQTHLTMLDAFGRALHPLRYYMWLCSVSCMFIAIYYVVECTTREMILSESVQRKINSELALGLLYANGTFSCGFFAGLVWQQGKFVNAFCFLASCYCFYQKLGCLDRMMGCAETVAKSRNIRGIALQYKLTRSAIFVVWHIFPLTWALAACNAISLEAEHMGYIFGDLLAKYLMLFVYAASINNYGSPLVPSPQVALDNADGSNVAVPVIGRPVNGASSPGAYGSFTTHRLVSGAIDPDHLLQARQ